MNTTHMLTCTADLSNLSLIADFIAEHLIESVVSDREIFDLQLAVDEACSNIVLYGYPGEKGSIRISLRIETGSVTIVLEDCGEPFNPLVAPSPDLEADLERRVVGGLGVHFIKSLMDTLTYEFRDGKNILTMKKALHT